jgi:hypothetical protein
MCPDTARYPITVDPRTAVPVTIAFSKQVATIIKVLPEALKLLTKYRHFI